MKKLLVKDILKVTEGKARAWKNKKGTGRSSERLSEIVWWERNTTGACGQI